MLLIMNQFTQKDASTKTTCNLKKYELCKNIGSTIATVVGAVQDNDKYSSTLK